MPDREPHGILPSDFAAQLSTLLAPGEADSAAQVIVQATRLDDEQLADFMERLAALVATSGGPLTAAQLRRLLPPAGS